MTPRWYYIIRVPGPWKLSLEGDPAHYYRRFVHGLNVYEVGARVKEQDATFRASILKSYLSAEVLELLETLPFENENHRKDVDRIETNFIDVTNETFERYKFNTVWDMSQHGGGKYQNSTHSPCMISKTGPGLRLVLTCLRSTTSTTSFLLITSLVTSRLMICGTHLREPSSGRWSTILLDMDCLASLFQTMDQNSHLKNSSNLLTNSTLHINQAALEIPPKLLSRGRGENSRPSSRKP